jgi:hypothetical protein
MIEYEVVRAVRVQKQGLRILIEVMAEDGSGWKGFDLSAPSALNLEKVLHELNQEMRGH